MQSVLQERTRITQYQLTRDSDILQRLFTGDGQVGRLVEAVLNQVLNAQVSEQLQAAPYERSDQRQGDRTGYTLRQLTTRVGALTLLVPQVRDGQFSTELFAHEQRSEQALILTLLEVVVNGVSTRTVARITEERCGTRCAQSPVPAPETAEGPPTAGAALCAPPPAPTPLPCSLPSPLRDELAEANAARHDWIAEDGRPQREVRGYYQRTADVRVSTTDPDATPMRPKGGGTHLGYQTHYVVDGGKRRIIVGVLVTPGEVMENQPMLDLLWRVRFRWKLWPRQVTGDTTYGTLENIAAVETAGIRAYVPLPNWKEKSDVWSAAHFRYEPEADQYRCPQETVLRRVGQPDTAGRQLYQAPASVCNRCSVKAQCTTGTQGRRVYRYAGEEFLERVRAYHETEAYEKALRKRRVWVEPLFAEAKDWHGMRRFRLRRLWRVNCEALLTAAGQNLKRLLAKRGWGRRPLPSGATVAIPTAQTQFVDLVVVWMILRRSVVPRPRPGTGALATIQISIAA